MMTTLKTISSISLSLCLTGCLAINTERPFDGAEDPRADLATMQSPDLAQPQAKCAAAKGLPGDNLLCVDFAQTSIAELMGKGWEISCDPAASWEITTAGKLQVQDFGSFKNQGCKFKLPAVNASDYSKYGNFTLSVIHSLNILRSDQTATIYLGQVIDKQQIWTGTGSIPRQQTNIAITKQALPNGGSGTYQPLFQIVVTTNAGLAGWQIESIAIQGNF